MRNSTTSSSFDPGGRTSLRIDVSGSGAEGSGVLG